MNLYKTTLTIDFFVIAKNQAEAKKIALQNACDAITEGQDDATVAVAKITSVNDVPPIWQDSLPYASDANPKAVTCSQFIRASDREDAGR